MSLDDVVNLSISIESSAISQAGFGRPLLLPGSVPFADRARIYSSPADMLADGFLSSDQAYLDAVGIASQNPRPLDWMVGKRDAFVAMVRRFRIEDSIAVAKVIDVTIDTVTDSVAYTFTVDGNAVTFNSDADATMAEIQAGLVAAGQAVGALTGVVTFAAESTNKVRVTSVLAGDDFTLTESDAKLSLTTVTANTPPSDGDYTVTLDGIEHTFAASASDLETIRDGLVAAIQASPRAAFFTAAAVAGNHGEFTVISDTAGIQFVWSVEAPDTASIKMVRRIAVVGNDPGVYSVTLNGNPVSGNFIGGETATQIRDALETAIDDAALGIDASANSTANLDLLSANDFTLAVSSPSSDITITAGYWTANVGIPEALDAIDAYDPDWYGLIITERTAGPIESAARAIETRRKIFFAQSAEAAILSAPYDSGNIDTDIASRLHGLALSRTAVFYHSNSTSAFAASLMGTLLARVPGSYTAKFKTLAGIEPDALTTTELAYARGNPVAGTQGKCCNVYTTIAGRNIVQEGTVASGEYIDVIHGADKLYSTIQGNVFGMLAKRPKVDFTSGGLRQVAAQIQAALEASADEGFLAQSRELSDGTIQKPAYTISVPAISSIPQASREKRTIPANKPITFEATLAGAIHAVSITGTLAA
ncbi:MAG: DUF3383 family protein [Deltaproteobacteria bacterium]|nr:DUF3383 family protein [Deltaproteobacteria bacterium]